MNNNLQMDKKTAHEWAFLACVEIVDADGWRRNDGVTLDTPIDARDFSDRIMESTICPL